MSVRNGLLFRVDFHDSFPLPYQAGDKNGIPCASPAGICSNLFQKMAVFLIVFKRQFMTALGGVV